MDLFHRRRSKERRLCYTCRERFSPGPFCISSPAVQLAALPAFTAFTYNRRYGKRLGDDMPSRFTLFILFSGCFFTFPFTAGFRSGPAGYNQGTNHVHQDLSCLLRLSFSALSL